MVSNTGCVSPGLHCKEREFEVVALTSVAHAVSVQDYTVKKEFEVGALNPVSNTVSFSPG